MILFRSEPQSYRGSVVGGWGVFCQLWVLTIAGLSVALASNLRLFLDEKFTLDGDYIETTLSVPDSSLSTSDPFRNIALLYRSLGLANSPDMAAMLSLALFGVAVFAAVRWEELALTTPLGLGVISACYVLAMIYLAQYSKEFASLLLVAAILLLPAGFWFECVLVAGMLGYAATIRPYWAVVAALYILGRLLLPRARGLVPVLGAVAVTYVGLQFVFNEFLGQALSHSRVAVNEGRAQINISVGSMIVDFLPNVDSLQWANAFLVFLSLVAPWPLLDGGSATFIGMAALLTFLWGLLAVSLLRVQEERAGSLLGDRVASRHEPLASRAPRVERAIALLLGLVVVQAIFEPDYGSYVKHLAPMLPLFLTLLPLSPVETLRPVEVPARPLSARGQKGAH